MRFFLLFLAAISVSALSEPIKDFAPDQVGNTWKYQIIFKTGDVGMIDSEYFSRTFKLTKIEIAQIALNSKRYLFDIIDSGIEIFIYNGNKGLASNIQKIHFDTLLQIEDSIQNTLPTTSMGTFFPLFKTSVIDTKDSGIKKVLYKNDSLFQFSDVYSYFAWTSHATYMQNIGLDSLSSFWYAGGNTRESLSAKLISYSIVPTSIAQSPKKFNPVQATRQNFPSAYIFDLQGRRFQQRSLSAFPPGLMINRGVSYLQVK
jgi:hypothetical protein